ncbi:MAG: FHA domain-containing protein, partial [Armatimonadetes bacterium]|nr:FHA domain-containing protein [Armatimonadota bacterium]
ALARRGDLGIPLEGTPLLLETKDAEHNISGLHCWVGFDPAGHVRVRDLGSMNGTYLGASAERVKEARIYHGQAVRLGRGGALRFTVQADEPDECRATIRGDEPKPDHATPAGKVIHLDRDILNIGRESDNDLMLDYPQVSRHHCRIVRRSDGTFIEDLGSMNGTFVNGHRVTQARLAKGDVINLGSFVLAFEHDRLCQSSYAGQVRLEACDIKKAVKDKTIIQDISFVSCPSEFIGLIGPSGSGKTTLLNVITGYDNTATGQVMFGGIDLYANYDALRGNVGYVPQDDIIHRELTVEQSLYYTAKLRLPEDTSEKELHRRVDKVISDLGLEDCRTVRIGDPEKRGISGGQRKRVNLAQELITEPACLFLDEPLSGLDPAKAVEVTEVLSEAAKGGRNVILTTHNVESPEAFKALGLVLLLHEGRLVYYGPAQEIFDYFGMGRDYPPKVLFYLQGKYCPKCDKMYARASKPLEKCETCGETMYRPVEYWEKKFVGSVYHERYVAGRMELRRVKTSVGSRAKRQHASALRQWRILVQRYWKIKLADTAGTAVLLAQAPVIALLIGLVFGDKGYPEMGGVLFMMAIAAIWFGATNSCREIVSERSVYRRERMVNLKIGPYVLSKGFVLGMLLFAQCLILSVIVKAMVGALPGSILGYTAVLALGGIAGSAMGLLVSAVLSSPEGAMGLVPVTLIPQVLFSGMVVNLTDLGKVKFLADFMISRWVLDALSHFSDKTVGAIKPALAATTEGAKTFYWFPEMPTLGMGLDVIVLVVITVLLTILTVVALKRKDIV